MFLFIGVCSGLVIGVIPGLSGIIGMALLVPFTYQLDPYAAIALLLGMGSVTTTSDTISAVLFGVPGTVGSAATVVDGHAMARKGESERAFGAAFSASMIGGIVGAFALALAIPLMRPIVASIASPELFAISIFGLSMVATLSAANPLRGLLSVCAGLAVAFIGLAPTTATDRWTYGTIYLWEGVPLVPLFLGLFGVPELFVLLKSKAIAVEKSALSAGGGLKTGIKDTLKNAPLVARMSFLGALLGAVPGIGAAVIDWIAYGVASRTIRRNNEFGQGDVRGVIAPESANNAKEGGALVPTIAFGIPGSASMTILLGALLVQGIVPGPDMLTKHLDLTVVMVLSVGLANILGTAICLGLTPYLARLAVVPSAIIVPVVLVFVMLGAFQANRDYGDLVTLLVFGVVGMVLGAANWSRSAFALGFVLGPAVERYFFISHSIYEWSWLTRPIVMIILALAIASFFRYLPEWFRAIRQRGLEPTRVASIPAAMLSFLAVTLSVFGVVTASAWPAGASLFPLVVFVVILAIGLVLLANDVIRLRAIDLRSGIRDKVVTPAVAGLVYLLGFLSLLALFVCFGPYVAVAVFIAVSVFRSGGISIRVVIPTIVGVLLTIWLLFDLAMNIPWPAPLVPIFSHFT